MEYRYKTKLLNIETLRKLNNLILRHKVKNKTIKTNVKINLNKDQHEHHTRRKSDVK